jgi:hypothetical protein
MLSLHLHQDGDLLRLIAVVDGEVMPVEGDREEVLDVLSAFVAGWIAHEGRRQGSGAGRAGACDGFTLSE